MEIMKHFKFLSILVMVVLAVVVIIGWNRRGVNEGFPRQGQGQGREQPTNQSGGIHPNLEPKKKPGCGVCQQKKMANAATTTPTTGRSTQSFDPVRNQKQKFI